MKKVFLNKLIVFLILAFSVLTFSFTGCTKISDNNTSVSDLQSLEKLCKVWGYVKYNHPAFLLGEKDWDKELLNLIPVVSEAKDDEVNDILHEWFVSLGKIDYGMDGANAALQEDKLYVQANISWIKDDTYLGKELSEDMQKLTILLKRENACREKYREIARSYALASSSWFARRKEQNFEQLCDTLNFYSSRKHSFFRKISVWRSVAIWTLLIGCSITFFYLYHSPSPEVLTPSYCQIEVPQGASSKLLLPDSTIVFLNGGTVLKYDVSLQQRTDRKVFLSGEAYFKVSRNMLKPFIVHTGELNIKVLGTTFNVASYPDDAEIKVSLVEGSVNVYTTSDAKKNILLSPDEQAVYNKNDKVLSMRKIDAVSQAAWTTGRLVFVNEKLFDILKTIGKKYDVQILVQSRKVYTEYFSGSIDTNLTLDEILSYLDVDNKFMWRKKGKTIVITDR